MEDIRTRNREMEKNPGFEIVLRGRTFTEHKEAGEFLRAISKHTVLNDEMDIGTYKGFELAFKKDSFDERIVIRGNCTYTVEIKKSNSGNMVRLENTLNGLDQVAEYIQKDIVTFEKEMENAKAEYEKEFSYEDLLKEKLKQQAEINTRLEIKDTEEIVADASEEEATVPQMAAAVRSL